MRITQPKRPGPNPRNRAVRPLLHQGGPGPRPLIWLVGPDPVRHAQYVAWGRARAQALYRGEGWDMTFDEFAEIWGTDWPRRGRASQDLCMTRPDLDLPWSVHNAELITRAEHNRRCAARKMALK